MEDDKDLEEKGLHPTWSDSCTGEEGERRNRQNDFKEGMNSNAPAESYRDEESSRREETPAAGAATKGALMDDVDGEKDETDRSLALTIHTVEGADDEPLLTEDAYSLLYTAEFCSRTAMFAWFSITLQGGMLMVTFFDLFDIAKNPNTTNDETNRMAVPPGSTVQVMIAQFLGMLVTAMVMAAEGDLVIGCTQLIKGYNPKIIRVSPHATWFRWLFTGVLQFIMGFFLLVDSFILSMQSSTVIDLVLNLTALHFIQELDNMAFTIASEAGLMGKRVQSDCEHVKKLKCFSSPNKRRRMKKFRRFLILVMTVGLLGPYFAVVHWQSDGLYICQTLYIQFGDEYRPEMAYYSGLFRSQGNSILDRWNHGQRNRYIDDTNTFKLSYCSADSYWTISYLDDDACDFIYRSAETTTFDVVEAAEENWLINTEGTKDIDADWLKIVCNDCTEETCNPDRGVCSASGDTCECLPGRYGVNCQYEEHCKWFGLDQRTTDGLSGISGASYIFKLEYSPLGANSTFNGMPIYIPWDYDPVTSNFSRPTHISTFMIFTGRRWTVYGLPDPLLEKIVKANGIPSNWTTESFIERFETYSKITNGYYAVSALTQSLANLRPIFFSSPLYYGQASFGWDPSSTSWVLAYNPEDNKFDNLTKRFPSDKEGIAARFLCSDCMNRNHDSNSSTIPPKNKCLNYGRCNDVGYCICPTFYTGYQCEKVKDCVSAGGCMNNGRCNPLTKNCECQEGSYGSLCHIGKGKEMVPDPFLCAECEFVGRGSCESTSSQECTCRNGWSGKYCNETLTGDVGFDAATIEPTVEVLPGGVAASGELEVQHEVSQVPLEVP